LGTADYRLAAQRAKQLAASVRQHGWASATVLPTSQGTILISDFLDKYHRSGVSRGLRPRSIAHAQKDLRRVTREIGVRRLAEPTPAALQTWIEGCGLKAVTLRSVLKNAACPFSRPSLQALGMAELQNPFARLVKPKVDREAFPAPARAWILGLKRGSGRKQPAASVWRLCGASRRTRLSASGPGAPKTPGAIKQWLVLAPIRFGDRSGAVALAQEQVPQEANLRPRAGEPAKAGRTERVWRAVQLEDHLINFNQLLGAETWWNVAYAVSYIQSEADQTGLLMKVGSDDQAKVYLNGKEIYQYAQARSYVPPQDVVAGVELKAGLNVLVFKLVNATVDWQGSVRFTDAAGQPVKGIRVTPSPP
jgi:hypothetical protein